MLGDERLEHFGFDAGCGAGFGLFRRALWVVAESAFGFRRRLRPPRLLRAATPVRSRAASASSDPASLPALSSTDDPASNATSVSAPSSPASSSPPSSAVNALSTCAGKYALSPRCRPPRTIARFTQTRPPSATDGENIDVAVAADLDRLLMQHRRQRTHLVAHRRGLLELQLARERMHLLLELLHHFALAAEQKARRVGDVACIVFFVDVADARRRAAVPI